jgi:hypothetical protein
MADASKLPTLDDFLVEETPLMTTQSQAAQTGTGTTVTPPAEDPAKAEAEAKAKAEAARAEEESKKKADAAKLAAAEAKKKAEEAKKAAAPTKTQEELDALLKKAEEKPETLTAEERQYLLDNDLAEEQSKNFWEEVEAIHGVKVEVDYQGKDPESAEGAAIRDQALMATAAQQQMAYLAENYPDAYKVLEHVANGGKITDLVNPDEPDFSKMQLPKEDKEAQRELLLNYYMQKGFDEKAAKRYVEADEDSAEGLHAVAEQALKQLAATQTAKQKQVMEQQRAAREEMEKRNVAFKQSIKQLTDNGKLGDFTILNKKDREEFYQYAVRNIYSDGKNGYQVVLPVDDKSMIPVLQQLFFGFKGGKLDDVVKREAQTMNVIRLKKKVAAATATAGGQEGGAPSKQNTLPTFDIFKAD